MENPKISFPEHLWAEVVIEGQVMDCCNKVQDLLYISHKNHEWTYMCSYFTAFTRYKNCLGGKNKYHVLGSAYWNSISEMK